MVRPPPRHLYLRHPLQPRHLLQPWRPAPATSEKESWKALARVHVRDALTAETRTDGAYATLVASTLASRIDTWRARTYTG